MVVECPGCASKMELSSEKYGGQRVSLKCPKCHQPFQADVPSVLGKSILIAHEDPAVCEQVQRALQGTFLNMETAHNGQTVLALVGMDAPDVLLLDVTLPGMLSFELVDRIHSREGSQPFPIVLLTSPYKKDTFRNTPESLYGAEEFVELPKLENLIATLTKVLQDPEPEDLETDNFEADDQKIKRRILEEVERLGAGIHEDSLEDIAALARLIVSNIGRCCQRCIDDPWHDMDCMDRLTLELGMGRQVLSQLVPGVRSHKTDYIKQAFGDYVRQRRLERAGAYYPGIDT